MYCHAMATLALCEAYALTGDDRLRDPVERAVAFLVRARARDGMAWRYAPGAPAGDTSILGWVVMGLKSAKEVGIPIPGEPSVRRGTLALAGQGRDRSGQGPGPLSALGAGHADHDRRGLGLPPVPGRRRARARPAPRRPSSCSATSRTAARPTSTTGITPRSLSTSTAANPGRSGTPRSATRSSACNPPRAIRREAGSPTAAFTEPRGAGSTARPWRPFRSRSTTATCGSTTNPRSRSKRAQPDAARNAAQVRARPRRSRSLIPMDRTARADRDGRSMNATVVQARPAVTRRRAITSRPGPFRSRR